MSSPKTPESIGRSTVSMARSESPAERSSSWVVRSDRCLSRPGGPMASNVVSRASAAASRSESRRIRIAPTTDGSGPSRCTIWFDEHPDPARERAQVQRVDVELARERRIRRADHLEPTVEPEAVASGRCAAGPRHRRPPPALSRRVRQRPAAEQPSTRPGQPPRRWRPHVPPSPQGRRHLRPRSAHWQDRTRLNSEIAEECDRSVERPGGPRPPTTPGTGSRSPHAARLRRRSRSPIPRPIRRGGPSDPSRMPSMLSPVASAASAYGPISQGQTVPWW